MSNLFIIWNFMLERSGCTSYVIGFYWLCICLLIFILFVVDTDTIFQFEPRKTWAFKMNKGAQSLWG